MSIIGFIGLGNMGLPMAINLKKAGHALQVFDTVPAALEKAKAEGMDHMPVLLPQAARRR